MIDKPYRILYMGGAIVCKPEQEYEDQKGIKRMSRARVDVEEGRFSFSASPAAIRALVKAMKDDQAFKKFLEDLEALNVAAGV